MCAIASTSTTSCSTTHGKRLCPPQGLLVGGKFRLGKRIASGSFGEVYKGTNIRTSEAVAIKLEPILSQRPQLLYEAKLCQILAGGLGVPKVHWYGVEGEHNVMVMERLGPSLAKVFGFCGNHFSSLVLARLAEQIINRIEFVHASGFVHRDVKPENFLIGAGSNVTQAQIYIIDFGLAKKYMLKQGRHIPYRENKSLMGNHSYASVNAHRGFEQSRRDDLESVAYMMVQFQRGKLSWDGLEHSSEQERHKSILEKKTSTSVASLCEGCPPEFATFLSYCRSLDFDERPNYAYLHKLLSGLTFTDECAYDFVPDWVVHYSSEEEEAEEPEHSWG